jgi:hypothetical protein
LLFRPLAFFLTNPTTVLRVEVQKCGQPTDAAHMAPNCALAPMERVRRDAQLESILAVRERGAVLMEAACLQDGVGTYASRLVGRLPRFSLSVMPPLLEHPDELLARMRHSSSHTRLCTNMLFYHYLELTQLYPPRERRDGLLYTAPVLHGLWQALLESSLLDDLREAAKGMHSAQREQCILLLQEASDIHWPLLAGLIILCRTALDRVGARNRRKGEARRGVERERVCVCVWTRD